MTQSTTTPRNDDPIANVSIAVQKSTVDSHTLRAITYKGRRLLRKELTAQRSEAAAALSRFFGMGDTCLTHDLVYCANVPSRNISAINRGK